MPESPNLSSSVSEVDLFGQFSEFHRTTVEGGSQRFPLAPECDRWAEVSESANVLLDFLQELGRQGLTLCRFHERREQFYPVETPYIGFVYEYFEIDPRKIEAELRALLDFARGLSEVSR